MSRYVLSQCLFAASVLIVASAPDITLPNDQALDYALATDFAEWGGSCQETTQLQSPIDIRKENGKQKNGKPLDLEFHTVASTELVLTSNNVELEFEGNFVTLTASDGVIYDAQQLHFHSPSEHTYEGFYCSAEMHIVMNARDGSDKHAVLAACLEASIPAQVDAFFERVTTQVDPTSVFDVSPGWTSGEFIDLSIASMKEALSKDYYAYSGSYTTPPCTLGISWYVIDPLTSIAIPPGMMEFMQRRFRQPANHRPLQPFLNREMTLYRTSASSDSDSEGSDSDTKGSDSDTEGSDSDTKQGEQSGSDNNRTVSD